MKTVFASWQFWALLAAVFAALTAVFAKIGVSDIGTGLATLVRTLVVVALLTVILTLTGGWQGISGLSGRPVLFLVLSGVATGASWLCYFHALKLGDAARVAPIDKLSVVLVALFGVWILGERLSTINWLGVVLITGGALLVAV
ncbi:EamA family transporter [Rhodospira trueperi]|uniref:Transporter family protein n=1 Tax=Rhodospira trueperi TaxID=69960 RepID=A0A1G7GXG2_9PROT|nr:EamA family transporter [Rhodospira trueperi]SDE92862.1 transporter family protein [Rhodospira trueperi]